MSQLELPGLPPSTDYHDFQQRLMYANVHSTPTRLHIFYQHAFPHVERIIKVSDLALQKQGIDTIVYLMNGKPIYFDEKIREKTFPDVLLEEFSIWHNYPYLNGHEIDCHEPVTKDWKGRLTPGWIGGHKVTDYITYVKRRSNQVYFLPFLLLQRAWLKNYPAWIVAYGRKAARNRTYHTTNIPIPDDILFRALFEEGQYTKGL